jgi:hypothetical protein
MDFMVADFAAVPEHLHIQPITVSGEVLIGCLGVEADELWSFVQKKRKPHWVWIAMDKQTRQIIAVHVGDRSRDSAMQLRQNVPETCREQATFYTDQYAAYLGVRSCLYRVRMIPAGQVPSGALRNRRVAPSPVPHSRTTLSLCITHLLPQPEKGPGKEARGANVSLLRTPLLRRTAITPGGWRGQECVRISAWRCSTGG